MMREFVTGIAWSVGMIAAMGAVYLFLFTAPAGILWLAGIVVIFAFGFMFGRASIRH